MQQYRETLYKAMTANNAHVWAFNGKSYAINLDVVNSLFDDRIWPSVVTEVTLELVDKLFWYFDGVGTEKISSVLDSLILEMIRYYHTKIRIKYGAEVRSLYTMITFAHYIGAKHYTILLIGDLLHELNESYTEQCCVMCDKKLCIYPCTSIGGDYYKATNAISINKNNFNTYKIKQYFSPEQCAHLQLVMKDCGIPEPIISDMHYYTFYKIQADSNELKKYLSILMQQK